jgi:hypothetical protein
MDLANLDFTKLRPTEVLTIRGEMVKRDEHRARMEKRKKLDKAFFWKALPPFKPHPPLVLFTSVYPCLRLILADYVCF